MLEEHPTHFVMDDGGSRFRVPRQGLSERTEAMIRGSGAKPKSYAVGGGVDALPERMDAGPVAYAVGEQGAPLIDEPAPLPVPGMAMRPGDSVPPPGPQYAPPIPIEQERALTAPVPEFVPPALPGAAPVAPVVMPEMDLRGPMDVAREEGQVAEQAKAAAIQQKADSEVALYAARDKQLRDQAALQQEIVKQGLRRSDEDMARIRGARDEMAKIDTTVDPGRFWATRSTGQKVLGIVGLALGALGAGNDGINRAAGLLQQAIDRDLEAQKAEHTMRLQKGQKAIDSATSIYALNHQMTQDEIALNAANNASAWAIVENQFKKAEAAAQGPMAQAQAKAGAAMAKQKQAEWDDAAKNRQLEIGIKQGELDVSRYKARTDRMEVEGKAAATAGDKYVTDGYELAPGAKISPTELADWRKGKGTADGLLKQIDTLSGMVDKNGVMVMGPNAKTAASIVADLKSNLKEVEKLGALSGSDYKLLDDQVPDPTAVTAWAKSLFPKSTTEAALQAGFKQLKANIAAKVEAQANVLGIRRTGQASPGSTATSAGPSGKPSASDRMRALIAEGLPNAEIKKRLASEGYGNK